MTDIPFELLSNDEFKEKFSKFEVGNQDTQVPTSFSLEANIVQFPLVSFKGDSRKERVWRKQITHQGNATEVVRELKFFAPGDMKLSNGIIDRKLQLLSFHLWQKYGCQENGIFWFTLRGLAEFLHLAPNGKNLKNIKEAMGRLQMTSIVSTNAITKKTDKGDLVTNSSEGYLSFFSNLQFVFTSSGKSLDIESTNNVSFAQIHKLFINNFMKEYCTKIDLNLSLKLKSPASLGLYLLLCSRPVNEEGELLISLTSLIDDIPLDPTKTKVVEYDRVLNKAIEDLTKNHILISASKKERQKSGQAGEKKVQRIYYLFKISKAVREIQLSLFPDTPKFDDSFAIDSLLSQIISLSGLDKSTAEKIMKSGEFEFEDFKSALEVTAYNTLKNTNEIKHPEKYIKSLTERKVTLNPSEKKALEKSLTGDQEIDFTKKEKVNFQIRPIPKSEEDLIVYLKNLGMWDNEAKNICRNQELNKVVLQINGWLIKHEGDELKGHIRELVSACKSKSGYESFNSTPFPESSNAKKWKIKGFHESLLFSSITDAEEFCQKNSISSDNVTEAPSK